jgi:hypothetical protein
MTEESTSTGSVRDLGYLVGVVEAISFELGKKKDSLKDDITRKSCQIEIIIDGNSY